MKFSKPLYQKIAQGAGIAGLIIVGLLWSSKFRIGPEMPSRLTELTETVGLPEVTICQNDDLHKNRGVKWIAYSCQAICPDQNWQNCVYPSSETDVQGRPLRLLTFVVDGMAGEIRFNEPNGDSYAAGLYLQSGAGGTVFPDINKEMKVFRKLLETDGILTASIRWRGGSLVSFIEGWATLRQAGEKSTLFEKTKRPAAVIKWVHDNLVPQNIRYGTLGCSAGSIATFSAAYWHGLDPIIDYQVLTGGPPIAFDLNAVCTGKATEEPAGVCAYDPTQSCVSAADCGGTSCALPSTELVGESVADYLHGVGRTCLAHKADEIFKQSSFRYRPGDWQQDSSVDFVMDINESDPGGGDDLSRGIVYQAGMVYRNLEVGPGASKNWVIHNGNHCRWATDSGFLETILGPMIRKGLKLTD